MRRGRVRRAEPVASARERAHERDVLGIVDPRQLLVGRRFRGEPGDRPDRLEQVDPGTEPPRRQGMAWPEVVGRRTWAEDQQRAGGIAVGHAGHDTARVGTRRPGSTIASVTDVAFVLIIILLIALVWRGPKTLPQLGAIFGRGVRAARDEAARMKSRDGKDQGSSST